MDYKFTLLTPLTYARPGSITVALQHGDEIANNFADYLTIHSRGLTYNHPRTQHCAYFENFDLFEEAMFHHSEYLLILVTLEALQQFEFFRRRLFVFLSMRPEWSNRIVIILLGNNTTLIKELDPEVFVNDQINFPLDNWDMHKTKFQILFNFLHVSWQSTTGTETGGSNENIDKPRIHRLSNISLTDISTLLEQREKNVSSTTLLTTTTTTTTTRAHTGSSESVNTSSTLSDVKSNKQTNLSVIETNNSNDIEENANATLTSIELTDSNGSNSVNNDQTIVLTETIKISSDNQCQEPHVTTIITKENRSSLLQDAFRDFQSNTSNGGNKTSVEETIQTRTGSDDGNDGGSTRTTKVTTTTTTTVKSINSQGNNENDSDSIKLSLEEALKSQLQQAITNQNQTAGDSVDGKIIQTVIKTSGNDEVVENVGQISFKDLSIDDHSLTMQQEMFRQMKSSEANAVQSESSRILETNGSTTVVRTEKIITTKLISGNVNDNEERDNTNNRSQVSLTGSSSSQQNEEETTSKKEIFTKSIDLEEALYALQSSKSRVMNETGQENNSGGFQTTTMVSGGDGEGENTSKSSSTTTTTTSTKTISKADVENIKSSKTDLLDRDGADLNMPSYGEIEEIHVNQDKKQIIYRFDQGNTLISEQQQQQQSPRSLSPVFINVSGRVTVATKLPHISSIDTHRSEIALSTEIKSQGGGLFTTSNLSGIHYQYKFTLLMPNTLSKIMSYDVELDKFVTDLSQLSENYEMNYRVVSEPQEAVIHSFNLYESKFLYNSEYALIVLSSATMECFTQFYARLTVFLSMKREWSNRFILLCLGKLQFKEYMVFDFLVHDPIIFPTENWLDAEDSWEELFKILRVRWIPYVDPQQNTVSSSEEYSEGTSLEYALGESNELTNQQTTEHSTTWVVQQEPMTTSVWSEQHQLGVYQQETDINQLPVKQQYTVEEASGQTAGQISDTHFHTTTTTTTSSTTPLTDKISIDSENNANNSSESSVIHSSSTITITTSTTNIGATTTTTTNKDSNTIVDNNEDKTMFKNLKSKATKILHGDKKESDDKHNSLDTLVKSSAGIMSLAASTTRTKQQDISINSTPTDQFNLLSKHFDNEEHFYEDKKELIGFEESEKSSLNLDVDLTNGNQSITTTTTTTATTTSTEILNPNLKTDLQSQENISSTTFSDHQSKSISLINKNDNDSFSSSALSVITVIEKNPIKQETSSEASSFVSISGSIESINPTTTTSSPKNENFTENKISSTSSINIISKTNNNFLTLRLGENQEHWLSDEDLSIIESDTPEITPVFEKKSISTTTTTSTIVSETNDVVAAADNLLEENQEIITCSSDESNETGGSEQNEEQLFISELTLEINKESVTSEVDTTSLIVEGSISSETISSAMDNDFSINETIYSTEIISLADEEEGLDDDQSQTQLTTFDDEIYTNGESQATSATVFGEQTTTIITTTTVIVKGNDASKVDKTIYNLQKNEQESFEILEEGKSSESDEAYCIEENQHEISSIEIAPTTTTSLSTESEQVTEESSQILHNIGQSTLESEEIKSTGTATVSNQSIVIVDEKETIIKPADLESHVVESRVEEHKMIDVSKIVESEEFNNESVEMTEKITGQPIVSLTQEIIKTTIISNQVNEQVMNNLCDDKCANVEEEEEEVTNVLQTSGQIEFLEKENVTKTIVISNESTVTVNGGQSDTLESTIHGNLVEFKIDETNENQPEYTESEEFMESVLIEEGIKGDPIVSVANETINQTIIISTQTTEQVDDNRGEQIGEATESSLTIHDFGQKTLDSVETNISTTVVVVSNETTTQNNVETRIEETTVDDLPESHEIEEFSESSTEVEEKVDGKEVVSVTKEIIQTTILSTQTAEQVKDIQSENVDEVTDSSHSHIDLETKVIIEEFVSESTNQNNSIESNLVESKVEETIVDDHPEYQESEEFSESLTVEEKVDGNKMASMTKEIVQTTTTTVISTQVTEQVNNIQSEKVDEVTDSSDSGHGIVHIDLETKVIIEEFVSESTNQNNSIETNLVESKVEETIVDDHPEYHETEEFSESVEEKVDGNETASVTKEIIQTTTTTTVISTQVTEQVNNIQSEKTEEIKDSSDVEEIGLETKTISTNVNTNESTTTVPSDKNNLQTFVVESRIEETTVHHPKPIEYEESFESHTIEEKIKEEPVISTTQEIIQTTIISSQAAEQVNEINKEVVESSHSVHDIGQIELETEQITTTIVTNESTTVIVGGELVTKTTTQISAEPHVVESRVEEKIEDQFSESTESKDFGETMPEGEAEKVTGEQIVSVTEQTIETTIISTQVKELENVDGGKTIDITDGSYEAAAHNIGEMSLTSERTDSTAITNVSSLIVDGSSQQESTTIKNVLHPYHVESKAEEETLDDKPLLENETFTETLTETISEESVASLAEETIHTTTIISSQSNEQIDKVDFGKESATGVVETNIHSMTIETDKTNNIAVTSSTSSIIVDETEDLNSFAIEKDIQRREVASYAFGSKENISNKEETNQEISNQNDEFIESYAIVENVGGESFVSWSEETFITSVNSSENQEQGNIDVIKREEVKDSSEEVDSVEQTEITVITDVINNQQIHHKSSEEEKDKEDGEITSSTTTVTTTVIKTTLTDESVGDFTIEKEVSDTTTFQESDGHEVDQSSTTLEDTSSTQISIRSFSEDNISDEENASEVIHKAEFIVSHSQPDFQQDVSDHEIDFQTKSSDTLVKSSYEDENYFKNNATSSSSSIAITTTSTTTTTTTTTVEEHEKHIPLGETDLQIEQKTIKEKSISMDEESGVNLRTTTTSVDIHVSTIGGKSTEDKTKPTDSSIGSSSSSIYKKKEKIDKSNKKDFDVQSKSKADWIFPIESTTTDDDNNITEEIFKEETIASQINQDFTDSNENNNPRDEDSNNRQILLISQQTRLSFITLRTEVWRFWISVGHRLLSVRNFLTFRRLTPFSSSSSSASSSITTAVQTERNETIVRVVSTYTWREFLMDMLFFGDPGWDHRQRRQTIQTIRTSEEIDHHHHGNVHNRHYYLSLVRTTSTNSITIIRRRIYRFILWLRSIIRFRRETRGQASSLSEEELANNERAVEPVSWATRRRQLMLALILMSSVYLAPHYYQFTNRMFMALCGFLGSQVDYAEAFLLPARWALRAIRADSVLLDNNGFGICPALNQSESRAMTNYFYIYRPPMNQRN